MTTTYKGIVNGRPRFDFKTDKGTPPPELIKRLDSGALRAVDGKLFAGQREIKVGEEV
jgi:hypothetical protein